jgi:AcrR family transcriptional regulator
MGQIAKAAGVAEKTVYLAFSTKAALLNEIIVSSIRSEGSERPFREQMQQALAAPPYALVNESVYLRLVDGLAWTPDQYRDWLARTLARALLARDAR